MIRTFIRSLPGMIVLPVAAVVLSGAAGLPAAAQGGLREALTFHASFDGGLDAAHAAGDPKLYSAPSMKERQDAKPGLAAAAQAERAPGAGRFGDALRFTAKKPPIVFYKAAGNMPYEKTDWDGTVSFWLSTDPEKQLEPGFCDPVQITPRAWNDAAFFVEFEKKPGAIPFRLGVYADLDMWNPQKRKFAEIPQSERPLVTVDDPPFAGGRWTHVAFTFQRFNTGKPDGVARLYLNGEPRGTLDGRQQTFTWDPREAIVGLGLGYIGLLDELSIFSRALTDAEVRTLFALDRGIR